MKTRIINSLKNLYGITIFSDDDYESAYHWAILNLIRYLGIYRGSYKSIKRVWNDLYSESDDNVNITQANGYIELEDTTQDGYIITPSIEFDDSIQLHVIRATPLVSPSTFDVTKLILDIKFDEYNWLSDYDANVAFNQYLDISKIYDKDLIFKIGISANYEYKISNIEFLCVMIPSTYSLWNESKIESVAALYLEKNLFIRSHIANEYEYAQKWYESIERKERELYGIQEFKGTNERKTDSKIGKIISSNNLM